MIYFSLCYHRNFTWCPLGDFPGSLFSWIHPWKSSRFSLLWCLLQVLHLVPPLAVFQVFFCQLEVGAWCCCSLVGCRCVICGQHWSGSISTSHCPPLCLLVYCLSAPVGIILNNSEIISMLYNVCRWLLLKMRLVLDFVKLPLNITLLAYLHQQTTLMEFSHFEG